MRSAEAAFGRTTRKGGARAGAAGADFSAPPVHRCKRLQLSQLARQKRSTVARIWYSSSNGRRSRCGSPSTGSEYGAALFGVWCQELWCSSLDATKLQRHVMQIPAKAFSLKPLVHLPCIWIYGTCSSPSSPSFTHDYWTFPYDLWWWEASGIELPDPR